MSTPEPNASESPDLRPTAVLLVLFLLVAALGVATVLLPGLRNDPDDPDAPTGEAETSGNTEASPPTPAPGDPPPPD
jgi:hypothetical protein